MTKLLLLTALLPGIVAHAQDKPFTVTASVKKYPDNAKAYLTYQTGSGKMTDSSAIVNGTFTFKGTVDEPRPAVIIIRREADKDGDSFLELYLDPGDITITSKSKLASAEIAGSANSLDNKEFQKLFMHAVTPFAPVPKEVMVTSQTYEVKTTTSTSGSMPPGTPTSVSRLPANAQPTGAKTSGMQRLEDLPPEARENILRSYTAAKSKALTFVKKHPGSYVSLNALNRMLKAGTLTAQEYQEWWEKLDPALRTSTQIKR